jgi:hypothetical protein
MTDAATATTPALDDQQEHPSGDDPSTATPMPSTKEDAASPPPPAPPPPAEPAVAPTGSNDGPLQVIAGGLTLVLGVLAAIATVNPPTVRLFRNNAVRIEVALIAVMLAALIVAVSIAFPKTSRYKRRLLVGGTIVGFLGLMAAVVLAVQGFSETNRPTILATTSKSPAGLDRYEVTVNISQARANDQLLVYARGLPIGAAEPADLFYEKSGPSLDGELRQDDQIDVASNQYSRIEVYAVSYQPGDSANEVDCDGKSLSASQAISDTAESTTTLANIANVSCLTINLARPGAPSTTATAP